jgi:HK97 family phage major capsid protein/HK97 family phage prohead protease
MKTNVKCTRHLQIKSADLQPSDDRTVTLAFSSDVPYERSFGMEILGHRRQEIRLGRLESGANVLVNHDPNDVIGVVDNVTIDEGDGLARAVVRFGRSPRAQEIYQDVLDGIRRSVSVGYVVYKFDEVKGQGQTKVYRASDWEPYEISLVSIPADITVGVGRSDDTPDTHPEVAPEPQPEPQTKAQPPIITTKEEPKMTEALTQHDPQARINGIYELKASYGSYVTEKDVETAIRSGHSVEQFKDTVMSKMSTKHMDTSSQYIGMNKKEVRNFSLMRLIQAQLTGDWSQAGLEREAVVAAAQRTGKPLSENGFFVPYDIFRRDFNVGVAGEAGNLVATDLRTDLFTDVLRNNLVMGSLGIRILTGLSSNIDIPRKTVASTISNVTEIQASTETQPTTAKVSLSPKGKRAHIEYSKQAILQSGIALESMLRDDLLKSMAATIENECINGSGTAPAMRGIRNTSGVGSVVGGPNGLALTWGHIVGLESAVANANAEPDGTAGYLINTRTRGTSKTTQKATNLQFLWDGGATPLNDYRAAVTNNVPNNLVKGSSGAVCSSVIFSSMWDMAVLALFDSPEITIDPYSLATTGQVRITINQHADFGIRQPAAFAVMDDALTP